MNAQLIELLEKKLKEKFENKKEYFNNFVLLDTGPEEWFRIEILDGIRLDKRIQVLSTNQKYKQILGRPDFVFQYSDQEYIVELKVLPLDRNYVSGYQRFCAGKTNRADFEALADGGINFIIYIHWPSKQDFQKTKANLEKRYAVLCSNEQQIEFENGCFTMSFWLRNV